MKYLRASTRLALGILSFPMMLGLTALQALVIGPLMGNDSMIPNLLYKWSSKLVGIKVEFNKASAPIVTDKPTWFVANHISTADFLPLGSKLKGNFVGKGEVLKWPVVAQIAKALKFMGLRRSSEYNGQSRAKIIKNFNKGHNTIMFPEGTTTDGSRVALFRAAMLKILYGETGVDKDGKTIPLKKDVVVQPVAIRVKTVNGKDATNNAELRDGYTMFNEESLFKRAWKRMQLKEVTLEVTVLPPLDPKAFKDERELINTAAQKIADVVNPGQKTFEKAQIPLVKAAA